MSDIEVFHVLDGLEQLKKEGSAYFLWKFLEIHQLEQLSMFSEFKHDGWSKFLSACKESPCLSVVVDHPDDVRGCYVG